MPCSLSVSSLSITVETPPEISEWSSRVLPPTSSTNCDHPPSISINHPSFNQSSEFQSINQSNHQPLSIRQHPSSNFQSINQSDQKATIADSSPSFIKTSANQPKQPPSIIHHRFVIQAQQSQFIIYPSSPFIQISINRSIKQTTISNYHPNIHRLLLRQKYHTNTHHPIIRNSYRMIIEQVLLARKYFLIFNELPSIIIRHRLCIIYHLSSIIDHPS